MKKILIIASLDQSANQQRAQSIQESLQKNNCQVSVLNDQQLFQHLLKITFFISSPVNFILYLFQNVLFKLKIRPYPLFAEMKLRGSILNSKISQIKPDVIICQNPQDMFCLFNKSNYFTVYDSPTIFFLETKNENIYELDDIKKIEKIERQVFKKTNLVSFHWETFFETARKNHIKITHPIIANWTCPNTPYKLHSHPKNKIIHIGKLNSEWVNPKLLENLQSKSYLKIDIFSYETPDSRYSNLKYNGYLKNLNNISQYKFGLITISDSDLRNHGFSAKHLTYIAHGIPVLCPEWRRDKLLAPATIYYNEKNFNDQVKKYSQPKEWHKKHIAAIKLKAKLTPENNLKKIIDTIKHG